MKDVGLEITAESAISLWKCKTEMLVPNCIGAYGRIWGFLPCRRIDGSKQRFGTIIAFLGPKQNFFLLTVCRSEQYFKNGGEKDHFAPIDSNAEAGPAFTFTICLKNCDAMRKSTGISRPAYSVLENQYKINQILFLILCLVQIHVIR